MQKQPMSNTYIFKAFPITFIDGIIRLEKNRQLEAIKSAER